MGINTRKICCLYVSNWHLSVMLVPYISKQINEDVGITTIFKNDVGENIKLLLEKLNLKNTKNTKKDGLGVNRLCSSEDLNNWINVAAEKAKQLSLLISNNSL